MRILQDNFPTGNKKTSEIAMLLPHMGEGTMPDIVPVRQALENMNVKVIEADISVPEAIRELDWASIDLIDLRYTRGSLTNFVKYMGLIDRLMDKIHQEELKGHSIAMLPGYEEIKWVASKANYFPHLEKHAIPMIPTRLIMRHSQGHRASTVDADNIEEAVQAALSHLRTSDVKKFVLKPSISSLAKRIVFIDCEQDGAFTLKFPYIDKESYSSVYEDEKSLAVFLRQYLEHTPCPDETFLLQDYVENIEISAVFVDGTPHFVRREPGCESRVAHYRYGGTDEVIRTPDRDLVMFVRDIYTALPTNIQNMPFLRIDVMWDSQHNKYVFGEIEGAGAARLWIEEAGRVDDYAAMLVKLAGGQKKPQEGFSAESMKNLRA